MAVHFTRRHLGLLTVLKFANNTIGAMIEDDLNLARLGHTQQLKRRFNIWSMLAFSSCLLGTWEGLSLTLISALQSGGPASLMYGLLLAWLGTLANAASLAEISSIYPTAGGQYHWTYCLTPPFARRFTSYIVGWIGCSGLVLRPLQSLSSADFKSKA